MTLLLANSPAASRRPRKTSGRRYRPGVGWYDDDYGWSDDYGTDYSGEGETWYDNGDGSWTDIATGGIYDDETGDFLGQWNDDGTWTDTDGYFYDENNSVLGYDYGDGYWSDVAGLIYDPEGNLYGVENGDGTWTDLAGFVYDENNNLLGTVGDEPSGISQFFSNVASGIGNFLSNLFGGSQHASGIGPSGGGIGGGMSGSSQAQQRAQQAAQQLAQAQAQGATPQQLAALQRQLGVAQYAQQRAGSGGGIFGNISPTTLAVGAGVILLALVMSRRSQPQPVVYYAQPRVS